MPWKECDWTILMESFGKTYKENTRKTKSQGKSKWETAEENGHVRRNKRHIEHSHHREFLAEVHLYKSTDAFL